MVEEHINPLKLKIPKVCTSCIPEVLPQDSCSLSYLPGELFVKNTLACLEIQHILKLLVLNREWETWVVSNSTIWSGIHEINFNEEASEKCMSNLLMKTKNALEKAKFYRCSNCTDKVLLSLTDGSFPRLHHIELVNVFNVETSSVEKVLYSVGNQLTHLQLVNCGVLSNRAVKTVCRQCPLLESFSLAGTRLSDSAINDVARRLKRLKKLALIRAVSVTWTAIRNLLEKLPLDELHLVACLGVFSRAFELRTIPPGSAQPMGINNGRNDAEFQETATENLGVQGNHAESDGEAEDEQPTEASVPVATVSLRHNLETLELDLTSADPEVFVFLGRHFSYLKDFSLRPLKASYLTDDNCRHFLSQFPELTRLKIKSTRITAESLKFFVTECQQLREVVFEEIQSISPRDIEWLLQARPELKCKLISCGS